VLDVKICDVEDPGELEIVRREQDTAPSTAAKALAKFAGPKAFSSCALLSCGLNWR